MPQPAILWPSPRNVLRQQLRIFLLQRVLPDTNCYSFTYPGGMEGWVGLSTMGVNNLLKVITGKWSGGTWTRDLVSHCPDTLQRRLGSDDIWRSGRSSCPIWSCVGSSLHTAPCMLWTISNQTTCRQITVFLYHPGLTCFLFLFLCRHFNLGIAKSLHSMIDTIIQLWILITSV